MVMSTPPVSSAAPDRPEPRYPNEGTWPPGPFRPADSRARVAKWAHAISGLLALALGVVMFQVFDLLDKEERFQLTEQEVDDFIGQLETVGAFGGLAAFVSFISLVAWLSRSVDNTPGLGGGIARRGPRWAIGAWIIPLVNIVMPALIIRDLARRISPDRSDRIWLVLLWWLAYWAPTIVEIYVGFLPLGGTDDLRVLYAWLIGMTVLDAAGYFMTIYLIRVLQRDADHWQRQRSQVPTPAAPVLPPAAG
jgi:hypothetical protein